jgi:hypothetical protein
MVTANTTRRHGDTNEVLNNGHGQTTPNQTKKDMFSSISIAGSNESFRVSL